MVLDPYRAPDSDIDSVWDNKKWEMPNGFCQVFRLCSDWKPYEKIELFTHDYNVFLDTDAWKAVRLGENGELVDFLVEPPSLAIFAKGHGESPAKVISSARETAECVSGLIKHLVGGGYPVLSLIYEAVFRKDNAKTIKFYPVHTRVQMTGVTRSNLLDALKPVSDGKVTGFPEHLRLAFRWYGKGIEDEHPVDRFIALYECSLAVVTRWHYMQHPEEYEGQDAPPRKQFRDWVRDVMKPVDSEEDDELFEPFNAIVGTRNRIFKANELIATPQDIAHAVVCARRVLKWSLSN